MRITKEHKRLARKKGWYDGHAKRSKESWPYDSVQLCNEYDYGYYDGLDADVHHNNPYAPVQGTKNECKS